MSKLLVLSLVLIAFTNNIAQTASKNLEIKARVLSLSGKIIDCKTVNTVQPLYPAMGKNVRASGEVRVVIKVNTQGIVTIAKSISGHPLLRASSIFAARQWKFDPASVQEFSLTKKAILSFTFILKGSSTPPPTIKPPSLDPVEKHFAQARKFSEHGQLELATKEIRQVLKIDPKHAWAYYELGMVQRDQNQIEEAGKSCLMARDLRFAELKAEGGGEQDMLYENTLMCLGMTAAITHKYDEAIGYFRKLSELEKSMCDVRSMLGTMLFHKGDYEGAEKSLKESLALKPDYVTSLFTLGEVYSAQNRWQEAIDSYKKCIEAEDGPFVPSSHYGLGIAYLRLGDKDLAMKEYQILKKINNPDKAEQLLQEMKK